MMIDNHVDGILLSVCDGAKNKTFYESLIARGLPLVLFDRHVDDIGVPQVLSDDYNSSFFLAEELIRQGCTRIVHMRGPAGISNSVDRLNGYRDALAKWHRAELVVEGGVSFRDGEMTALALLDSGVAFDAVHAFTEMSLLGAKSIIQQRGKRIPQDILVACLSLVSREQTSVKWFIRRLRLWSRTLKVLLIRLLISWSIFYPERKYPVRLSISLLSV